MIPHQIHELDLVAYEVFDTGGERETAKRYARGLASDSWLLPPGS